MSTTDHPATPEMTTTTTTEMTTTTTPYEQLGELYVETLCQNAYYQGAAGTIVHAVHAAAGCGDAPDGPDLTRAAAKLTRDAMGFLQRCIGRVSNDWIENECDWNRVDQFWDTHATQAEYRFGDHLAEGTEAEIEAAQAEALWAQGQLSEQADRAWRTYFEHLRRPDDSGLGARWHHDLALAATFLQAAAMLVADAFNIETEVSQ